MSYGFDNEEHDPKKEAEDTFQTVKWVFIGIVVVSTLVTAWSYTTITVSQAGRTPYLIFFFEVLCLIAYWIHKKL